MPLPAGFSAAFSAGFSVAAGAEEGADPKNSETSFPLRALATALTRLASTYTPEALMTALRESALISAPAPLRTKAA